MRSGYIVFLQMNSCSVGSSGSSYLAVYRVGMKRIFRHSECGSCGSAEMTVVGGPLGPVNVVYMKVRSVDLWWLRLLYLLGCRHEGRIKCRSVLSVFRPGNHYA